jgi:uncharacterized membrane protein
MNNNSNPPESYRQLVQMTLVILLFEAALIITLVLNDAPYSNAMVGVLVATVVLAAANRRLAAASQGRHTRSYVLAWRYGVLALLVVCSVLVALRAYAPQVTPDGMPTVIAMLVSAAIGLKGAVLGKLRPNGVLGLRVRWTRQSRLAWERAHRLMGRVLFAGGLMCLAAAPFIPFVAVFVAVGCVVLIGVSAASIESWRVWRDDPEREVAG